MDANEIFKNVMEEMKKHIAGKEDVMELLFLAIVANGHALLEGVPGVAKTTLTKTLASIINADFKRIQGTPDLEPKDIIGYTYVGENNSIELKKGPVFTNLLLVDELNRAPPKTMSALLETLEERQVTIGGSDIRLPRPFTAYATQNPLKIEGTEPLPKVLADRFIMKIDVTYPSVQEEEQMLRIKEREEKTEVKKIVNIEDILALQDEAKKIVMPDEVAEFIANIVSATRSDIHVVMGASPRADIAFMQCGKAKALVEGRKEVTKDDIRFLAKPVLSHRIVVRSTGGIGVHGVIDG
ncbi:MAG: AAA family ATPase, partial [Candidatus Micrarchaeia archaeon]